jgi:cyclohexanecarboxylate-CoA ligase
VRNDAMIDSIPHALDAAVGHSSQQTLTWHDPPGGAEITFAELAAAARRVAGGLQGLGLEPGAVIVSQLPACSEEVILLHAATRAGFIVAPVVPTRGARDVQQIVRDTGAQAYVGMAGNEARLKRWAFEGSDKESSLRSVIRVGPTAPGTVSWTDLDRAVGSAESAAVGPDDTAVILFTAGTTSRPKAVVHRHANLLARAASGIPGADDGPHRELSILPTGHIGGILRNVRSLLTGIPVVHLVRWHPDVALDVIASRAITSTSLTPFFLKQLVEVQRGAPRDTSSLRHILVGGANVEPSLVCDAAELGWCVVRSYGSTEHPMSFVGSVADPLDRRANTDGRAACGVTARIVGPDGRESSPGDSGELQLQGPAQFSGYLDRDDTAAAFTSDGWFRTGDVGRIDESGFLTITGRMKDIIIRGGENISAAEVEDLLRTIPGVSDAAVVGYPDQRYGERACAFLELQPGTQVALDDIRSHFDALEVDRRKTPERLVIADRLPRTATGKVAKHELRASALDASDDPVHRP